MVSRQVRKAKPQVRRRVTAWIESDRLTTKARRHKEETRHEEVVRAGAPSPRLGVGMAPNDGGVQPARSGCAKGIEKTGSIPAAKSALQPSRQPPIPQREHNE